MTYLGFPPGQKRFSTQLRFHRPYSVKLHTCWTNFTLHKSPHRACWRGNPQVEQRGRNLYPAVLKEENDLNESSVTRRRRSSAVDGSPDSKSTNLTCLDSRERCTGSNLKSSPLFPPLSGASERRMSVSSEIQSAETKMKSKETVSETMMRGEDHIKLQPAVERVAERNGECQR